MRGLEKKPNVLLIALVLAPLAVLGACDANSPTAPTQTANAPSSTTATTNFAISVGLSPSTVTLGESTTVQVTVVARRTDTNALVPQGSTSVLTTTSGTLTNEDASETGSTVTLTFGLNGTALATLIGAVETAVIRAQIEQSFAQATLTVAEAPTVTPFTLLQVTPNFGPPAGGTEVQIEGTGFSLPTEVTFGGIAVSAISVTSSVIRVLSPQVELPSGENLTVSIDVSVNVGEDDAASGTLSNIFTYTRNSSPIIPKIISITPTSGPNEGGTRVTIFGEAFGSEVQVFFGASSFVEAPVIDVTPTRILVDSPSATGQNSASLNQVVSVRVVDLRSGFEASLSDAFQYGGGDLEITAIAPNEGLYLGGTLVTIFGTGGFEAPVVVEFGGFAQQVVSVSGTEIVARSVAVEVSCDPPPGATLVVNIETGENGSGPDFLYRTVTPEIVSVTTDTAIADVDTGAVTSPSPAEMTMFGFGFDRQSNPPAVDFDGRLAGVAITSIDPNPFYDGYGIGDVMVIGIPSVLVPWPEESCSEGGVNGSRYSNREITLTVTARDTGCSADMLFTYLPSDGSCRLDPVDPVAPVAEFSWTFPGGAGTTIISVTDLSTNSPDTLLWDFGDGAVENGTPGETRSHAYTALPGATFSVILTATNDGGTGQVTKTVTIP